MQPAKINYKIYQGSTFLETLRWESETKIYSPISAIAKSAPCIITTSQAHNLPTGWRFRVVGAGGMKEINSLADDAYYVSSTTVSESAQLQAIWEEMEAVWEDARNADAVTIAPATRPWANMPSYQAYQVLLSYTPTGQIPPPPSSFAAMLNSTRQAYLNWQNNTATSTTIRINQLNSLGFSTYTSGGVIEYNTPIPLTGYTAQMQIRESLDSTSPILELTSTPALGSGITLNTNDNTILITISAAATRNFTFDTAVYSLELTNASGVVTPFLSGNLTLVKEVTR